MDRVVLFHLVASGRCWISQTAWWAITTTDASGSGHLAAALEQAVRPGHDTDTTAR